MKRFVLILLGLSAGLLASCDTKQSAATAPPTPAPSGPGKVASAVYECPMGCKGSQSNKPGKCPNCEMDLVKKS